MAGIDFSKIDGFNWDKGNKDKNEIKHDVKPKECEEIFFNNPVFFKDETHSQKEERYAAYGISNERRLLMVIFTVRNNKIRVISARDQNKKELKEYNQWKK